VVNVAVLTAWVLTQRAAFQLRYNSRLAGLGSTLVGREEMLNIVAWVLWGGVDPPVQANASLAPIAWCSARAYA
jgi:hypothetical protein